MKVKPEEPERLSNILNIGEIGLQTSNMIDRIAERKPLLDIEEKVKLPPKFKSGWLRVTLAVLVSAAWMVVSSALIIVNKYAPIQPVACFSEAAPYHACGSSFCKTTSS